MCYKIFCDDTEHKAEKGVDKMVFNFVLEMNKRETTGMAAADKLVASQPTKGSQHIEYYLLVVL